MKKIIYKLIFKYPLFILLLKTPLKKYFINYMKKFRFRKKNILAKLLNYIFWNEYYAKLNDPEEIKKISDFTHSDGQGRKRSEILFQYPF